MDTMSADKHYNKGVALLEAGRRSDALAEFQKAVKLRTDFAEAYNMLGFTYRKLGKISHLTRAVRRGWRAFVSGGDDVLLEHSRHAPIIE